MYVISKNQYDSLQDGFKEEKDYMYKTQSAKDEIEVGKELTNQIKPYEEHSTFSARVRSKSKSTNRRTHFICRFLYWYCIFRLCRKLPLLPFILDLEDDTRLFEMIRKVGLTRGELSKVVTIRLALLFFSSSWSCNITRGSSINCVRTNV